MVEVKRQLIFKPTDEEEEYLDSTGKLISWTDTVRGWINNDRRKNKKLFVDKLRDGILLIVMGVVLFALILFLSPSNLTNITIIIVLFSISALAVTFGAVSIFWELYLHVRG